MDAKDSQAEDPEAIRRYGDGSCSAVQATRNAWSEKTRKGQEWARTLSSERRKKHEERSKRAELRKKVRQGQLAEKRASVSHPDQRSLVLANT